jgi:hypothetical protein
MLTFLLLMSNLCSQRYLHDDYWDQDAYGCDNKGVIWRNILYLVPRHEYRLRSATFLSATGYAFMGLGTER